MTKGHFDDVNFWLDVDSAPPEIIQWSIDNIGEGDKDIKIYELREMIYERGDFMPHRIDDVYLLKFLRARNFNLESTYKLLMNYYEFKENNPELHVNVNPLLLEFIGEDDVIQVLPYREQTERRVMIIKFGNWNTEKYSIEDVFTGTLAILELGSLEPRAQILGGICIFDFKDITLSHVWQITPSVAKKVVQLMVTSFPLKVSSVHITYESKVFDFIYKIFQPLLNNKMREKIFFHGSNMESLHQHINPKYLPERYGGIRPNYRYTKWIKKLGVEPRMKADICQLEHHMAISVIMNELSSLGYNITQDSIDKYINPNTERTSDSE